VTLFRAVLVLVLAAATSACKKPPPPPTEVAPVVDAMATPALDPMSAGAKEDFAKKYSCPDDRVTTKIRTDIDPRQALASASELKVATPPDEVKDDPGRLARWQADQDAERESRRRSYSSNTMIEVTGCGHSQIVACRPHHQGSATYPDWADCRAPERVPGGGPADPGMTAKLTRGKVSISLGTPGAKVFLVSGSDRREISVLPVSLDVTDEWSVVGTKPGYTDYTQRVSFDDGQPQRSYVVTLQRIGAKP
jgi:hypothetical protein